MRNRLQPDHCPSASLSQVRDVPGAAWREVEAERKRPWRLARRLGLATLLDYALGRLTMSAAIARLGRQIGVEAALVPAPDGRAAIDVDKPEDLALVRRLAVAD